MPQQNIIPQERIERMIYQISAFALGSITIMSLGIIPAIRNATNMFNLPEFGGDFGQLATLGALGAICAVMYASVLLVTVCRQEPERIIPLDNNLQQQPALQQPAPAVIVERPAVEQQPPVRRPAYSA